ncbi:MAG TPA: uracil-DNA glycosylase family protein, partial [Methylotenera sp.]|nr:uracil-DNA glycosylase family protein [Methylotenera sp.]
PNPSEIQNCSNWLSMELELLKPSLILPVGKLAISQFMEVDKLEDVVGQKHAIKVNNHKTDIIPLPHPSGASVWHRKDPGKQLLHDALVQIKHHKTWRETIRSAD